MASLTVAAGTGLAPITAHADEATGTSSASVVDIAAIIAGMSRRQKIEQRLMPDFRQWGGADFTVITGEVAKIINEYDFGIIILFANNVKETEQTLNLCRAMQAAALRNDSDTPYGDIPPPLTIDQEGGIAYRLGSGTGLPGNMAVGAIRSANDALQCGEVIGRELAPLMINVNFAPALTPTATHTTP